MVTTGEAIPKDDPKSEKQAKLSFEPVQPTPLHDKTAADFASDLSFSVTDLIISQPEEGIILTENNKKELYERLSLIRNNLLKNTNEYDAIFCTFTYDVFALFHDAESLSDMEIVRNIEAL